MTQTKPLIYGLVSGAFVYLAMKFGSPEPVIIGFAMSFGFLVGRFEDMEKRMEKALTMQSKKLFPELWDD